MNTGFAAGAASIDGRYVPIDEARIPILDRGFLRSDVTYDVVAVWGGAFFRLEDHLERFARSCQELRFVLPYSRDEIVGILSDLVRLTGLREAYVNVTCTRGVGGTRDPRTSKSHQFYAYAVPYAWILEQDDAEHGMSAIVAQSVHRIPVTSVDPTVKNFHWGDFTRAQFEAYERGGAYPVLLDGEGNVTEGAGYNLFAMVDGRLVTPATGALEGVTRRTVLELAAVDGVDAEATAVTVAQFRDATELFATSTAGGVMPITSLDGRPVGGGGVGPTTRRLRELYWAAHSDPQYITPIDYTKPVDDLAHAAG